MLGMTTLDVLRVCLPINPEETVPEYRDGDGVYPGQESMSL